MAPASTTTTVGPPATWIGSSRARFPAPSPWSGRAATTSPSTSRPPGPSASPCLNHCSCAQTRSSNKDSAMAKGAAKKATKVGAVEKKLISVADAVINAAERSKDPTLTIPVRSLANVNFNEKRGIIEMGRRKQARTFFNVGMATKFMQTVLVADALSELQRADLTTSLREIYYRTKHTIQDSHENTFDTQDESDPVIEDLEVSLAALREELHVRAENGGSIVGPVIFGDDGDRVDCARLGKGGYSVPSIVEPEYIEIRRCTADFVPLVEKGTQWNRLVEGQFLAPVHLCPAHR